MSNTTTPCWFIESSRPYHITIRDILSIPIGKTVRLFVIERNMNNTGIITGKKTKPSKFFQNGYYVDFTRRKDLLGDWQWIYQNKQQDIEYNRNFYLDIGKLWYPMVDSYIPIMDLRDLHIIPKQYGGKHFRDIDPDTRIGWRGPMMFAKDLDQCPSIRR